MRFIKNKAFIALATATLTLAVAVLTIGISTNGFSFLGSNSVVEKISNEISKNNVEKEEDSLITLELSENVESKNNVIEPPKDNNALDSKPTASQEVLKVDETEEESKNNEIVSNIYSGKIPVEDIIAEQSESTIYSQYHYMDLASLEDNNDNLPSTVPNVDKNVNKVIILLLTKLSSHFYDFDSNGNATHYRYNVDTGIEECIDTINDNINQSIYNVYFDTGRIVSTKDNIQTIIWPILAVKQDEQGHPKITRTNFVYVETKNVSTGKVLSHKLSGGYDVDGDSKYLGIDGKWHKNYPTGIYSALKDDEKLQILKSLISSILGENAIEDFTSAIVNSDDLGLLYAGFIADLDNAIFTTSVTAPAQRNAGFTAFYDTAAQFAMMTYDTFRLKFDFGGIKWMLQPWKGQYGVLCGAEVGFYYEDQGRKNYGVNNFVTNSNFVQSLAQLPSKFDPDYDTTVYSCSEDPYLLTMSYDLYKNKELVIGTDEIEHWWLTVFRMGGLTDPSTLTLDTYMKFENSNVHLYDSSFVGLEESNGKIRYTAEFFDKFVESILEYNEQNEKANIEFLRNGKLLDKLGAKPTQPHLYVYEINFEERSIRFVWGDPNNISDDILSNWNSYGAPNNTTLVKYNENKNVSAIQEAFTVIGIDKASDKVKELITNINSNYTTMKTH